jgi:hypothetical protein
MREAWLSKMCESCESWDGLDCRGGGGEGLLCLGLAPGDGEGGAKAKEGLVALDAMEVSEALRRRGGDVGGWFWC